MSDQRDRPQDRRAPVSDDFDAETGRIAAWRTDQAGALRRIHALVDRVREAEARARELADGGATQ